MRGDDGASRVHAFLPTCQIHFQWHPALDSPCCITRRSWLFAQPPSLVHTRCTTTGDLRGENMLEPEATPQCDIALRSQIGCLWLMPLEIPQARRPGVVQRQREASGGCAGLHLALVVTAASHRACSNSSERDPLLRYLKRTSQRVGQILLSASPERRH
jgi:hypothetical protein